MAAAEEAEDLFRVYGLGTGCWVRGAGEGPDLEEALLAVEDVLPENAELVDVRGLVNGTQDVSVEWEDFDTLDECRCTPFWLEDA